MDMFFLLFSWLFKVNEKVLSNFRFYYTFLWFSKESTGKQKTEGKVAFFHKFFITANLHSFKRKRQPLMKKLIRYYFFVDFFSLYRRIVNYSFAIKKLEHSWKFSILQTRKFQVFDSNSCIAWEKSTWVNLPTSSWFFTVGKMYVYTPIHRSSIKIKF